MIKKLGFMTIMSVFFLSCVKSGNVIPNVSVNFQSTLINPALNDIRLPGGAKFIPGYGVAGIIIYHEPSTSNGTYVAYDACSTYMPQNKCAVTLDNTPITYTVTDPCSGAKFSLADGGPAKKPATVALKSYRVYTDGFNISVTN